MKKLAAVFLMAALLAPLAASPALARGGHDNRGRHYTSHNNQRGYWHHGWHNGHYGKWWVAGPHRVYYPAHPVRYYYPPAYHHAPVYHPVARPVYVAPPPSGAFFSFSFK